jgi:transcriptional regulator with XRE-family HTH domain
MGLSQAAMGDRLRLTGNSVARMERGEVTITPSMELLIGYIAKECGVEVADSKRDRRAIAGKAADGSKARHSVRRARRGKALPPRRR